MTKEEEFRAYMKAANSTLGNHDNRHVSEERMVAYCRGAMPAAEREAAQAHLIDCEQCIALFRNANDFLESARAGDEAVTAAETDKAWQSLLPRLHITPLRNAEEEGARIMQPEFRRPLLKGLSVDSRITLALAASLLIAFGALGSLTWRFRQERESRRQSQQIAVQLESKQREIEQRLSQLEQSGGDQLKKEQDQRLAAEAKRDQLQSELTTLQQAGLNIPVYTAMLSSERGAQDDLRLNFTAAAPVTLLRLMIGKPYEFPEYSIEFVDEHGNMVREISGLRPTGDDGALSTLINRATFNAGKYKLRLSGRRGKTRKQLGEYDLSVTMR
ncbi:MAG: hypothetical protein JWM21_2936 [Acidobacteria bacterium]|nr:hypothetical protein [Acidobacteriota bacterium]